MRRRYRTYNSYNQSFYKSKFFFSEKEIDFTSEYLDYDQFILQEFFTADAETRKKLENYYISKSGSRSFAYLNRKYTEWANGDYHLTKLMRERIIAIMQIFLTDNAKHKLSIHEFMASIKNTVQSFQFAQKRRYRNISNLKRPEEIFFIFEKEKNEIKALTIPNFRFNILTEEEKEHALEISKFILVIKLQKAFDQIESDFNIFLPFMLTFKESNFSANYSIINLNINVNITNTGLVEVVIPKFKIKEIEANSRFREYSDKYIAYELQLIQKESNISSINTQLSKNDISMFIERYKQLLNGASEVSINSSFQGEGGVLKINLQIKPFQLIKKSIKITLIKLLSYSFAVIILISLAIKYEFIILLIFVALPLGIFTSSFVSEKIKQLKSLIKEFKNYGQ